MKKRIGVQFRKSRTTAYTYERLKTCRHCGTYHVLWDTHCAACGREYLPIRQVSSVVTRRYVQSRFLLLGLFVCLAVLCAQTVRELAIACGGGIVLFALFFLIQKKYGHYEKNAHFYRYLTQEKDNIKQALISQLKEIREDVRAEHIKEAYEKIREVGHFVDSDAIKIQKIMFLNHFVLRKDMDLELETLIPADFDRDFLLYLGEVVKVKPWLVKKAVLDYVKRYKAQILMQENGDRLIGQVAAAALRMSAYVEQYQDLIIEFIDYLPRERLLRLAKMARNHRHEGWERLYEAAKQRIVTHYSFDPDFKSVL